MKKLIIIFALMAGLLFAVSGLAQSGPKQIDFGPKEKLTIVSGDKQNEFMVEIADTPEELAYGYMFREVVGPKDGMLFEFGTEKIASIWMKNTSVFLDILFVRKDGKILKIEHSAKPYSLRSMTSEAPVSAVIELAGGQANDLGIRPGDLVKHKYFNTAK